MVKRVSGPKNLPREASGRAHRKSRMFPATVNRGRSLMKQEESKRGQGTKAKAKARVEERPKVRGKPSKATCAEGLGTPRECAPVRDGSTTWKETRPKEKTPLKANCEQKRTTRHSNWDTLAGSLAR